MSLMPDLPAIQKRTYDLIVIGGGINGAATARDAALRGLVVLLLDKDDFAGGTTSWSTRLVHGGLRYLEYFEFALVRESLREREILLRTAPHLVKPIQLTIPIYRGGSRHYWEIQAGMVLYDTLSYDKSLPNHRMLPAKKFRQLFRSVDHEAAQGAAQYYDGQVEYAERLCLEIVLDAKAAGADVLNYTTVTDLKRQGDRITGLTIHHQHSGQTLDISLPAAAVVANIAGPWVDQILGLGRQTAQADDFGSDRKIGGTKGSHIIVDPFPGAPDTALYVEAKSDGRPYFIVPWLGQYLIGTTDLPYDGDLNAVKADDAEIDYLLKETNQVLPTAHLTRDHVRFTYSGVRPLPYSEGKKAGSITRSHILYDHTREGVSNLLSLIGGKLTTHRQVGEEITDWAFKKRRQPIPTCPTRDRPLPGCIWPDDDRLQQVFARYGDRIPSNGLDYLKQVYGANAPGVLALVDEIPELAQPIQADRPEIQAQIVYAVRSEMAQTLLDITRRRTTLAMAGNYGLDILPTLLDILQRHCDWQPDRCEQQLQAYQTFMEENCMPDYAIQSPSGSRPQAVATAASDL